MKTNSILLALVATISFTQTFEAAYAKPINKRHNKGRAPAAEQKKRTKKIVTSKEMQEMKAKLSKLEQDLKDKEAIIQAKTKELADSQNAKEDERIQRLNKLLEDQKNQIALLSEQIKNTEVRDVTIVNQKNISVKNDFQIILCQAKAQQEKLEDEVKKLIKDKEDVVNQIEALKLQNEELKKKSSSEVKVEDKKEDKKAEDKKDEDKAEKKIARKQKIEDSESDKEESDVSTLALMNKITNMLMSQQQAQLQMQAQMFTMMNSMSSMNYMDQGYSMNSFMYQNPYTSYNDMYSYNPYAAWGGYYSYPNMNSNSIFSNSGVGIGMNSQDRQPSSQSVYQPQAINQSQVSNQESQLAPQVRYFDFNRSSTDFTLKQPELIQMQKSNI